MMTTINLETRDGGGMKVRDGKVGRVSGKNRIPWTREGGRKEIDFAMGFEGLAILVSAREIYQSAKNESK
jgi:hypothetical protein